MKFGTFKFNGINIIYVKLREVIKSAVQSLLPTSAVLKYQLSLQWTARMDINIQTYVQDVRKSSKKGTTPCIHTWRSTCISSYVVYISNLGQIIS